MASVNDRSVSRIKQKQLRICEKKRPILVRFKDTIRDGRPRESINAADLGEVVRRWVAVLHFVSFLVGCVVLLALLDMEAKDNMLDIGGHPYSPHVATVSHVTSAVDAHKSENKTELTVQVQINHLQSSKKA